MRRTSIEELNEEISDLEESDAEESDAKSSDLSSSASEEEKSEVGSSDSDLEDSSIESNSTQKEQDNRREKRFSDLQDSLKNLANDEVTQEQAFRFHILADKFLAPKEGQIIPQYDDLFVIRRWFWINELEVLDNLSPFDFLFQKVNMDVLSPKYYKDIGVLRQESSIFLKYPEGLVRSFHYHFVSIIEEEQILTKFKEVYEAYKASLSNKESDEYKKAESQISFIIEVCNINDVFSHKGIYLTTFSPELLTFLLELNIQFDNVDFIERVYKERPELISREFLITHKAKLSGIWDLEKEFLQAVEQVNLAEIKKLIDRKVNISSTQSCQELLDQKIGTSSLRELSQNQFFRNGHPVNALFLCATIIHEDSREEIWAYLVFKGIRVRIPWQNGLDTDTYSAFDYFTDLNKNIKLRNFAQRIQSRINAMSQKLSQTIQCNLESMTSIIPSSLAEKTSLSVRNIYDAIFDSELHRGGNSVGYNFGKIDKETFALIKPILQVISSDYSMNITVDLASKNIGNLLSYSNTTIPRGMYYGS
ncbi:MAG: hypothetical protein HOM96_06130, partial [Rickettsiales bacterium]|nr:hypothetical protein [Rickettsiales bacterium]